MRDTGTEREATSRIGYIEMAMAIAPIIGPMLGGVWGYFFGWRTTRVPDRIGPFGGFRTKFVHRGDYVLRTT